jgi:hypothetical protein
MSSPATQQSTRLRSLETAYEQKTAARTYAQLHISKTQHADLNQNQQDGEGASQQGEHRRGDRKILGMPKVHAPATVEQETAGAAGTLELEKPNGKTSRNELRYAPTSKRRVSRSSMRPYRSGAWRARRRLRTSSLSSPVTARVM